MRGKLRPPCGSSQEDLDALVLEPFATVRWNDGTFSIAARVGNVIRLDPLAPEPPSAEELADLRRIVRIIGWLTELARSGLIDDPIFVAGLKGLETAVLDHLDSRSW